MSGQDKGVVGVGVVRTNSLVSEEFDSGDVDGWPGLYWLEQTAAPGVWRCVDSVSRQHYECKITGKLLRTHAIVRALNWWNQLFADLNAINNK